MLTKLSVTEDELTALVAPVGELRSAVPLTGGMFASAYRIELADGRQVVAKIVSADTARLLQYERGILATEAAIYRVAAGHVPVPTVLHEDFSRTIVAGDAVVVTFLSGTPWQTITLSEEQTATVRTNLGKAMAAMHRITGEKFGYPAPESELAAATWREAFTLMVEAVLGDAARWNVSQPVDRVRAALAQHGHLLDAVNRPALIHNDLWEGNIFVNPESLVIVGIIDTERALWGDPLLDIAGSDQFGIGEVNPDLLAGNSAAGGVLATELSSADGPTRLALYRMYYALLLSTEGTVRGYDPEGMAWFQTTSEANLESALVSLGQ